MASCSRGPTSRSPSLFFAAFGADRLLRPPAYLATVTGRRRGAGAPGDADRVCRRVSTCSWNRPRRRPEICESGAGPAMHNGVPDTEGSGGEFFLSGEGIAVDDDAVPPGWRPQRHTNRPSATCSSSSSSVPRANGYGDVTLPEPSRWSARVPEHRASAVAVQRRRLLSRASEQRHPGEHGVAMSRSEPRSRCGGTGDPASTNEASTLIVLRTRM